DGDAERIGHAAVLVVAIEHADELVADADLRGGAPLARRIDDDVVVPEGLAQVILNAGNLVRRHRRSSRPALGRRNSPRPRAIIAAPPEYPQYAVGGGPVQPSGARSAPPPARSASRSRLRPRALEACCALLAVGFETAARHRGTAVTSCRRGRRATERPAPTCGMACSEGSSGRRRRSFPRWHPARIPRSEEP